MVNKTIPAPFSVCGLLLVNSVAAPDPKATFDEAHQTLVLWERREGW